MKKRSFVFLLFWAMMLIAFAQEKAVSTTKEAEDNRVYDIVEVNATFPGGEDALFKWLSANMHYPSKARDEGIQGRVIVKFIVEKDGSITKLNVVRSPDPSLSKEAKRLFKKMPEWIPAMQGGKTVRSNYTLPLVFKLS